ncbi:MAG: alpha/beta hydrolase, partial [Candidatus Binatia bacterium]
NGYASCLGAQADVAHQIIEQLRSGSYSASGATPVTFANVALVGHSAGGATAQIAAYSFANMDALAVLSYADQGASDLALEAFGETAASCLTGGEPDDAGLPTGYAAFGQTDEGFQALMFHDAAPAVVAAATAMRNPDPCGDDASLPGEIVASTLLLRSFAKPTLILCGKEDAIFPPEACDSQQSLYPTADLVLLDDIGHALTLENEADAFRDQLSGWLAGKGF